MHNLLCQLRHRSPCLVVFVLFCLYGLVLFFQGVHNKLFLLFSYFNYIGFLFINVSMFFETYKKYNIRYFSFLCSFSFLIHFFCNLNSLPNNSNYSCCYHAKHQ